MTPTRPPAGWYDDPWCDGAYRYWDGTGWTGSTAADGTTVALAEDAPAVGVSNAAGSGDRLTTFGDELASRGDLLAELSRDGYDALQDGRWPRTNVLWRRWVDARCQQRPERRPWLYLEAAVPLVVLGLAALWVLRPLWSLLGVALLTLLGLALIIGLASVVASLFGHLAEGTGTAPPPARRPTMSVTGPYLSSPQAALPARPDQGPTVNLWELTDREPADHLAGNHHVLLAAHARIRTGMAFLTCSDEHDAVHAFALAMGGEVVDSFDRGHWRTTPSPQPAPLTRRCSVRSWRYLHGVKVPDATHAGRQLLHTELATPHLGHGSITGVLTVAVDG